MVGHDKSEDIAMIIVIALLHLHVFVDVEAVIGICCDKIIIDGNFFTCSIFRFAGFKAESVKNQPVFLLSAAGDGEQDQSSGYNEKQMLFHVGNLQSRKGTFRPLESARPRNR